MVEKILKNSAEIEKVLQSESHFRNRWQLYLEVLRVNHWFKNVFVLIGSIAAISYYKLPFNFTVLSNIIIIFIASCFLSSVNYIINGIVDKPFDAKHPRKKFRAIPQGLLKMWELVFSAISLLIITLVGTWYLLNPQCVYILVLFFIAGIFYNIRPLRTKDLPYLDVISEAVNNPIRLFLGWFALAVGQTYPPVIFIISLIFLFWCFGCFLMTAKRYAEFRFLQEDSVGYRITFKYYSERALYAAMLLYIALTLLFFILFTMKYHQRLLLLLPGIIAFIIWFLVITKQEDSIVKEPEKIYKNRIFFSYSIVLSILLIWLSL